MQNTHGIQNSMINANASFQAGLVVDATNAHRSYFPGVERPCEADRVVLHPDQGSTCSTSPSRDVADSKQSLIRREARERGRGTETLCSRLDGSWRLDASHQLPTAAWAMLVLSRSISG